MILLAHWVARGMADSHCKKEKNGMNLAEKRVLLKNGQECTLKSPGSSDAEVILAHLKQTAGETDYLIRYPEEVTLTVKEEEEFLANYQDDPKSVMILALVDGKIVGIAGLSCVQDVMKYRHRAGFGISVQKACWNLGIGTMLIQELIRFAETAGYEQVELEVVGENEQAVRLYQKLGFEIYGTRERSSKYKDGTYSSDHLMLRRLSKPL